MWKQTLVGLLLCGTLFGAASSKLEALKLSKRFGIGVSAGGPLAVLGMEADVNITETFSLSMGLGTGIDYSTYMIKGRFFLMGEWVSPYAAIGVARWWTDGTSETDIGPAVLTNQFLEPGTNLNNGFSIWILHPGIGVQFMHPMGFAISAELQYFFELFSLANGTYAGLAMHWYL